MEIKPYTGYYITKGVPLCISLVITICISLYSQPSDFSRALGLIIHEYPNYPKFLSADKFFLSGKQVLSQNGNDTFTALCRITDQFNDPHLTLISNGSLSALNRDLEASVLKGNHRNKLLSTKEGFYINEYSNVIIRIAIPSNGRLDAFVEQSSNPNLSIGTPFISAVKESKNVYYGRYLDANSNKIHCGRIHFVNDSTFLTGVFSKFKRVDSLSGMMTFQLRPQISFPDSLTCLISLPCSSEYCRIQLDSIVRGNIGQLYRRPNLILDLRKNIGGKSSVIDPLLPFIYTNPILKHQSDYFSTPLSHAESLSELEKVIKSPKQDSSLIKEWQEWVLIEKQNLGRFIAETGDTIVFDTILQNPRNIHIICDYSNQSAAELMILMASQSKKVTIWGQKTHGGVDYLNYRALKLSSENYEFFIPTTRRVIHRYGVRYDGIGIFPDKLIPEGESVINIILQKAPVARVY